MGGRVFAFLTVVAIACSLSVALASAEPEKVDMHGIRNFSRIDGTSGFAGPGAGFGGATQPSAMHGLKSAGFVTVMNLRVASEEDVRIEANRAAAEANGLNYVYLPFDTDNPDPAVVQAFLAIARDEANQPVYIHCNSATRAAALWMIGRVLEDGWEIDAASAEADIIADKPASAIAFASAYIASQGR
jgi:uncharacterized protein (TIGR01244 family)